MPPRHLHFAVSTALLGASLSLACASKTTRTSNPGPDMPEPAEPGPASNPGPVDVPEPAEPGPASNPGPVDAPAEPGPA